MANETGTVGVISETDRNIKHVLLVDDEFDITQTFAWLFEWNGFGVLTASNGKEALEMLDKRMPDVIISDCMMPIMDGIKLSRQLRDNPATQRIPIILMSAAPAKHNLADAAFDVFLQKPFRFEALLEAVNRLLASKSGERTA
jgi:CheY-like chemotaxis protein